MAKKSLSKKVELFERLAVYGSRSEFLNSLGQTYMEEQVITPSKNPFDAEVSDLTNKFEEKPKSFKLLNDGDKINPDLQKALVKLFPETAAWVKADGVMGPNTRGALNRYKQVYNDSRDLAEPEFQRDVIRKSYIPTPAR